MWSRCREITRDYAGSWEGREPGCYHLRSKGQFLFLKRSTNFLPRARARLTRCPEVGTRGIETLISLSSLPPVSCQDFPLTKSKPRLEGIEPLMSSIQVSQPGERKGGVGRRMDLLVHMQAIWHVLKLTTETFILGTSLVAQWLRIRLPMQGTRVRALVWEDSTCCGATKPVRHNY